MMGISGREDHGGERMRAMSVSSSAVAIDDTHIEAEKKQFSIVGKDYPTEEHAIGFFNLGDHGGHGGEDGPR